MAEHDWLPLLPILPAPPSKVPKWDLGCLPQASSVSRGGPAGRGSRNVSGEVPSRVLQGRMKWGGASLGQRSLLSDYLMHGILPADGCIQGFATGWGAPKAAGTEPPTSLPHSILAVPPPPQRKKAFLSRTECNQQVPCLSCLKERGLAC